MKGDALVVSMNEFYDVKALIRENEELIIKFQKNVLAAESAEEGARKFLQENEDLLKEVRGKIGSFGKIIPFPGASSDVNGSES